MLSLLLYFKAAVHKIPGSQANYPLVCTLKLNLLQRTLKPEHFLEEFKCLTLLLTQKICICTDCQWCQCMNCVTSMCQKSKLATCFLHQRYMNVNPVRWSVSTSGTLQCKKIRMFDTQLWGSCSKTMNTSSVAMLLVLTCSWAAAAFRAAGTADVAAAGMWTALAPADPNQEQQQQEANNHQNNQEPVCVGQKGEH